MAHGAGSKKRKRELQAQAQKGNKHRTSTSHSNGTEPEVDTSRPSAVFIPGKGRPYTLSIALPGSIIANCLTHDIKTALCGSIARAAAVFSVDEIVLFDDGQAPTSATPADGYTGFSDPGGFLHHVLSYLETPPHLRKVLFPMHPDLRTAGALPSLDMPHHLKRHEECRWREGVVVEDGGEGQGMSTVDCGLKDKVEVAVELDAGTRVTVRLDGEVEGMAEAVAPDEPREQGGYYWGYACRTAASLAAVFTECPFEGGYDVSVGTSERGRPVTELLNKEEAAVDPNWQHLLVVFGGVAGLESALKADNELLERGVEDVKDVFDHWVNLVPGQGSRTIRTEEAVWVGLMGLRQLVVDRGLQ